MTRGLGGGIVAVALPLVAAGVLAGMGGLTASPQLTVATSGNATYVAV